MGKEKIEVEGIRIGRVRRVGWRLEDIFL